MLKPIDFTGKVAMVTAGGANGGIGHAIALGLAQLGADILVGDIDTQGAATTAEEVRALGRRAVAATCDMGSDVDILRAFERLDQEFGQVDVLVNNAGIGKHEHPEEVSLDTWNRIMAVNITGQFLAAREAGKRMISRGHGGCIINISSIAGSSALGRGNFAYSVSKGAVIQFTHELAVEWAHHGIRVNAIQPAQVMTPPMHVLLANPKFNSDRLLARFLTGIPMNRLGEPEDIAGAAVFLASDLAGWITGVCLPVDGGNLALNAGGSHTWPSD
ncbi:MAG: SDR family oxidoreductase [Dehalococcoidales bacterium]|nr:SDR family oxidoreductase [Dehalococcoidales bacterium]